MDALGGGRTNGSRGGADSTAAWRLVCLDGDWPAILVPVSGVCQHASGKG